jgi:hypothetical protein
VALAGAAPGVEAGAGAAGGGSAGVGAPLPPALAVVPVAIPEVLVEAWLKIFDIKVWNRPMVLSLQVIEVVMRIRNCLSERMQDQAENVILA